MARWRLLDGVYTWFAWNCLGSDIGIVLQLFECSEFVRKFLCERGVGRNQLTSSKSSKPVCRAETCCHHTNCHQLFSRSFCQNILKQDKSSLKNLAFYSISTSTRSSSTAAFIGIYRRGMPLFKTIGILHVKDFSK